MQNKTQRHGGTEKPIYYNEELSGRIIASAIEVHRNLGPGLLESAYEECFVMNYTYRKFPLRDKNHYL